MSAGGAFGGARGLQPKPPEKGVFPLDHFGECKPIKEAYMKCLAENKSDAEACRPLAKQYLQCRMQRNLMAPQDLKDLGFTEEGGQKAKLEPAAQQQEQRRAPAPAPRPQARRPIGGPAWSTQVEVRALRGGRQRPAPRLVGGPFPTAAPDAPSSLIPLPDRCPEPVANASCNGSF